MARLDGTETIAVNDHAEKLIQQGFESLAQANIVHHAQDHRFDLPRGIENVTYAMLRMLAFRTQLEWGGTYAEAAQRTELGDVDGHAGLPSLPLAIDAFATSAHRDAASLAIKLFEGQPQFQGAAFREIARAFLTARNWAVVNFEVLIIAQAAGFAVKSKGALYDAMAERVLRRLAEHRFTHWPTGIDLLLSPVASAIAQNGLPVIATAEQNHALKTKGTALSVVFEKWAKKSKATAKSKDELIPYLSNHDW